MDDLKISSPIEYQPKNNDDLSTKKVKPFFGDKGFFKHWTGVVVFVVLAALITWGLLNLPEIINAVQGKYTAWKTQRQIAALERPYRTDKIGGKTPEETFDMFIAALKNEDIELASKYFVLKKQDDWEKTLEEYKRNNLLASFVIELEENRKNWSLFDNDGGIVTFKYTFVIDKPYEEELPLGNGKTQKLTHPAGKFDANISFEKYPTGIWKIDLL